MSGPNEDLPAAEGTTGPLAFIRRSAMVLAPIGVVVGVVMIMGVLDATKPKPKKKDEGPGAVAVQIAPVESRATRLSITVQGEARPRTQAALAAQVSGRIVAVDPAFAAGGAFRARQSLVRIDDADYRLAVIRARSQVAQAREGVAREEAEAQLARSDWEALGQGQKASPLALREPQLAQAKAALDAAQAQLRSAELDLERTHVRAPFDGRVRARKLNVGDFVGPGAIVGEVFATDVMEVRVPLTDGDLALLQTPVGFNASAQRRGPEAHLSAQVGGQQRKWEGRLVRTEAAVDAQTRLVYGTVEVRDPFSSRLGAPLAPGLFVTAHIDGAATETFAAAPRSALKRNEFIYVVTAENTIDVRTVRAAQTTGDEVYFRNGVKPGERVVVSHLPSPRQGMKVTPIARAASADAGDDLRQRSE
jgi:RND family efflux transporter MFP subunit